MIQISNVRIYLHNLIIVIYILKNTFGWKLLVEWNGGSISWVKLKHLKLELDEYAEANEKGDEPALKWWVKETIKGKYHINLKVNSK